MYNGGAGRVHVADGAMVESELAAEACNFLLFVDEM